MGRYTDEQNALLLIALLKQKNIRRIIISPGSTNIPLSHSVEHDTFFTLYSAFDERSAAYMACGLAAETREPVVISCTGATASRNYLPGLTEAFYRKLPVLAVTSMHWTQDRGNLRTQIIDRSVAPKDVARYSTSLEPITTDYERVDEELRINRALSELERDGGGPVHIQLITSGLNTFSTVTLPKVHVIDRVTTANSEKWPALNQSREIVVVIGAHHKFDAAESEALDTFIEKHNSIVFTDVSSGYQGKFAFQSALSTIQLTDNPISNKFKPDLIIHVGETSGDYNTTGYLDSIHAEVWRVSLDGEFRQFYKWLRYTFQTDTTEFFNHYARDVEKVDSPFRSTWVDYDHHLRARIPKLPFSNIWICQQLARLVPKGSVVQPAILSSLSSLDYFPLEEVDTTANVGGFGIDGCVSSLIGASLSDETKLYFSIVGDLAFFYDMNSLGNREIRSNVRILLINNNVGMTFELSNHIGSKFGLETNNYIAAGGHNIRHFAAPAQSKHTASPAQAWAESLGFSYLRAHNKEEFASHIPDFVSTSDSPILFECFTESKEERKARDLIDSIDNRKSAQARIKTIAKRHLPDGIVKGLKGMLGR